MRREYERAHRRNARVVATALPIELRADVFSHRFRGRATVARPDLDPAMRTRFSAARAALDMAEGRGRRIADLQQLNREIHQALTVLNRADETAVRRAVRLLHEIVPIGDDVTERAKVVAELEPVGASEIELWPLVSSVARTLAGNASPTSVIRPSPEILAADAAFGSTLDRVLHMHHPLAVLAALQVGPAKLDRRRFEATVGLFDSCFSGYVVEIDPWTATTDIWDGQYVDTTGLMTFEIEAHRTMDLAACGSVREAQAVWRQVVQPLTWVNAGLRRLERFGADVGDFLLLPTEPRPLPNTGCNELHPVCAGETCSKSRAFRWADSAQCAVSISRRHLLHYMPILLTWVSNEVSSTVTRRSGSERSTPLVDLPSAGLIGSSDRALSSLPLMRSPVGSSSDFLIAPTRPKVGSRSPSFAGPAVIRMFA
jgi:hypothetical protein